MASLPNENNFDTCSTSSQSKDFPVCSIKFEDGIRWNKFNREMHVKAFLKRKNTDNPPKKRRIILNEKIKPINQFLSK